MQHSIEEERKFHQRLISRIKNLLEEVVKKLRDFSYDLPGQRRNDENFERDFQLSADESYYGVIFIRDLESGQILQFRVGRRPVFGDVQDDGIHDGVLSWRSPLAAIYNREDGTSNADLKYGETCCKAQVVFENGVVSELIESRAARDARVRSEIQKSKTENLGDILETIRPDQDSLVRIRESLPVVIQGGPGTEKPLWGCRDLPMRQLITMVPIKMKSYLQLGQREVTSIM